MQPLDLLLCAFALIEAGERGANFPVKLTLVVVVEWTLRIRNLEIFFSKKSVHFGNKVDSQLPVFDFTAVRILFLDCIAAELVAHESYRLNGCLPESTPKYLH